MSNSLPMALLRPSCAALRPSAPVAHQWNSVTRAFARSFCSQKSLVDSNSRPSLFSIIQSHTSPLSVRQRRSFFLTPRASAKVADPDQPARPPAPPPKKRTVRVGLLPGGEVDKQTIQSIFGPDISVTDGNNVLRILHHRRTSGSLADYGIDNLGHRYTGIGHKRAKKALEWLRQAYPIDEARAAEEWAEKEANRIAYELWLADPENADSKYNDPATIERFKDQQQEIEEMNQQEEQRMGLLRTGPSEFERNIQRKRQERLEAIAKKAEEKEVKAKEEEKMLATGEWVRTPGGTALMKPGQDTYVDVFGREQVSRRKEVMELYQKKSATPFETPEDMLKATTTFQRLYPMTAFVAVVLLMCYGFAHYYVPPSPAYRLWPDLSLTTATIAAIIGTNVVVCLMWRWAPLWPFMTKYMMHVPGYPRAIQSVTNVFSHIQYEHMLANMMNLALVGTLCCNLVGRGIFLGTYIAAGAMGSLFTLYWANLGRGSIASHSVGASAASWGIMALYLLVTDRDSVKIPFVKDMEVGFWPLTLLCILLAIEVRSSFHRHTTIDNASHWGGILTGLTVGGYLRATGFKERKTQERLRSGESKTIDFGAVVKEEVKEVKDVVTKTVK